MKRFNYEAVIDNHNKRYKKSLIIFIISLVIFVSLFVTGILIATYENKKMIMIIFSLLLAVTAIFAITILMFGMIENKKNEKRLLYILGGYMNLVKGKVVQINDSFTTISGRVATEIILEDNGQQISTYFDHSLGENPFSLNDTVSLKTSESFIVEYEVENA